MKKEIFAAVAALSLLVGVNNVAAKTVDMCIGQGNSSDHRNAQKLVNYKNIEEIESNGVISILEKVFWRIQLVLGMSNGNVIIANDKLNKLNDSFRTNYDIKKDVSHLIGKCTAEIKRKNNATNKRTQQLRNQLNLN
jgi:hypothetical protein